MNVVDVIMVGIVDNRGWMWTLSSDSETIVVTARVERDWEAAVKLP